MGHIESFLIWVVLKNTLVVVVGVSDSRDMLKLETFRQLLIKERGNMGTLQ